VCRESNTSCITPHVLQPDFSTICMCNHLSNIGIIYDQNLNIHNSRFTIHDSRLVRDLVRQKPFGFWTDDIGMKVLRSYSFGDGSEPGISSGSTPVSADGTRGALQA